MPIKVKICGLSTEATLDAAVEAGAGYVGFVFVPRSPRSITSERARDLARRLPPSIEGCGLFVDPNPAELLRIVDRVPLDILQFHGGETPEFCAGMAARTGRRVMKALQIRDARSLDALERWTGAVDFLLLDAPPAPEAALPGGNGVAFDWSVLSGRRFALPWLLAGGLTAANLERAVRTTGARQIDVSSGVETAPGVKDPALIRALLAVARGLP